MRRSCILILVVIMMVMICGCKNEKPATETEQSLFGEFSATTMTGDVIDETVFHGKKLTMINIWATFCPPCIEEMPYLGQLQSEYGDEFQIIGIVVDAADMNGNVLSDKKAEAASIIAQTGADYLHVLPSKTLISAYLSQVRAVPETIFVDEDGNQVGQQYLGAKSKAQWKAIIDSLLKD